MTLKNNYEQSCPWLKYQPYAMWAMSSPCGHPGTICIFATGGGSGDFSGNVLCKVYWSKTPAYDCFSDMAAKLLLTLMLVFLCVCEGGELYSTQSLKLGHFFYHLCKWFHLLMLQLCWRNPQRWSSFRKWKRSVPQSAFPEIAAQKLAS